MVGISLNISNAIQKSSIQKLPSNKLDPINETMHIKSINANMHFKKALQRVFVGVLFFNLIVSDDIP